MLEEDQNIAAADLTRQVLAVVSASPDERFREISQALVRHLHAFVREVRPTHEEWQEAIEFLTRVGQACVGGRQEFVLLSDVLGVSMLVETLNGSDEDGVTENTVLGPFYVNDPPPVADGGLLTADAKGVPLLVEGLTVDPAGRPLPGVMIDVWQADADGMYDVQYGGEARLRARLTSDDSGRFSFWSVVPASYPVPTDGPVGELLRAQARHAFRPAHVHFRLTPRGGRTLTTHLFAKGDPYLGSDAVFGVRPSLIESFELHDPAELERDDAPAGPFAWVRRTFVLSAH